MEEEKKYLSPEEAALYLGVHTSTIYRYVGQLKNPLPSYKISRKNIVIKKEDIDSWVDGYFQ